MGLSVENKHLSDLVGQFVRATVGQLGKYGDISGKVGIVRSVYYDYAAREMYKVQFGKTLIELLGSNFELISIEEVLDGAELFEWKDVIKKLKDCGMSSPKEALSHSTFLEILESLKIKTQEKMKKR